MRISIVLKPASDTYCEFRLNAWNEIEVYSAVVYSNELVHHCLVGPLGEQWGYGVVSSVENQEQRRNLCQTEVK